MKNTKSNKKGYSSIAAQMIEQFIESGKYPQLKQAEKKIKILTSSMKERLETSECKRHVFKKQQLVGRFIAKPIYETDTVALNEYLYDLGLLLHVVEIDNKKIQGNELYFTMIQDFKLPDTFYVKPSFNKAGNALNKLPEPFDVTDDWSLDDMAEMLASLKPEVKILGNEYEKLKVNLLHLQEFQELKRIPKEDRTPIKHKYGSLSIVTNPARYNISAIYDYLGEGLLIEYGTPSSKLLEQFILNGTINKSELDQFKTLKDIRLDFSVMTIDDEQKMLEMLDHKNKIAAANRMAG
jgi:hypothetical protein